MNRKFCWKRGISTAFAGKSNTSPEHCALENRARKIARFDRDLNLVPKLAQGKWGSITVESGSDAGPVELRVGRILAERGMNVTHPKLVHRDRHKNPDLVVDADKWEIKSPNGSSLKNTINNQFRRGRKQADQLILDLSRCGLSDNVSISQAERRFFGMAQFKKMIIIDKNEEVYFYVL